MLLLALMQQASAELFDVKPTDLAGSSQDESCCEARRVFVKAAHQEGFSIDAIAYHIGQPSRVVNQMLRTENVEGLELNRLWQKFLQKMEVFLEAGKAVTLSKTS